MPLVPAASEDDRLVVELPHGHVGGALEVELGDGERLHYDVGSSTRSTPRETAATSGCRRLRCETAAAPGRDAARRRGACARPEPSRPPHRRRPPRATARRRTGRRSAAHRRRLPGRSGSSRGRIARTRGRAGAGLERRRAGPRPRTHLHRWSSPTTPPRCACSMRFARSASSSRRAADTFAVTPAAAVASAPSASFRRRPGSRTSASTLARRTHSSRATSASRSVSSTRVSRSSRRRLRRPRRGGWSPRPPRLVAVAVLEIGADRQVGGGGDRGDVRDHQVARRRCCRAARARTRSRRWSSPAPRTRAGRAAAPCPRSQDSGMMNAPARS